MQNNRDFIYQNARTFQITGKHANSFVVAIESLAKLESMLIDFLWFLESEKTFL